MTGNLYALLGLAEAIVFNLPAAVHRSKTFVRRTPNCWAAVIGRVRTTSGATVIRRCTDAAGPNTASAGEVLTP